MTEPVSHETECFTPKVAQQIALKLQGRRSHVDHGGTLCSRCYDEPPLPNQRYGRRCHKRAQQEARDRKKADRQRRRALAEQLCMAAMEEKQGQSKGNDNEQHQSGYPPPTTSHEDEPGGCSGLPSD